MKHKWNDGKMVISQLPMELNDGKGLFHYDYMQSTRKWAEIGEAGRKRRIPARIVWNVIRFYSLSLAHWCMCVTVHSTQHKYHSANDFACLAVPSKPFRSATIFRATAAIKRLSVGCFSQRNFGVVWLLLSTQLQTDILLFIYSVSFGRARSHTHRSFCLHLSALVVV